jgi:hypothetical protein
VVVMGAAVAMVGDSGAPGQFAPTYLAVAALAAAGAVVATCATRATALTRHPPSPTGLDAGTAL